jgi:hypothetical protein
MVGLPLTPDWTHEARFCITGLLISMHQVAVKSRESDRSAPLSPTPNTAIEMETQQPPTPVRIDNWHALGFIYGEESTTEAPADILHESPSTIPFDEDSPPHQPSSEPLPPSQGVGPTASSPSPVVNFID